MILSSLTVRLNRYTYSSDTILVPIQCEYYALEGLSQLMHTIELVQERLNPSLKIEGVVFTMYDANRYTYRQVVENVKNNLHQEIYKQLFPETYDLQRRQAMECRLIIMTENQRGPKVIGCWRKK